MCPSLCWYTNDAVSKASSGYTGARADVVFSLGKFDKGCGLWMKEVDTKDSAVRVRLPSPKPSRKGFVGNVAQQVPDLARSRNEDFVHVPECTEPSIVQS